LVQSLSSSGSTTWTLPVNNGDGCAGGIGDAAGNAYLLAQQKDGNTRILKLSPSGSILWSTPIGGWVGWRAPPVLGWNGSVFFSLWNGGVSNFLLLLYF
jgi:hypothetical protein